jgi:hypothetical protein
VSVFVDTSAFHAVLGLFTAFSFDQHFSEQGFQLIPAVR